MTLSVAALKGPSWELPGGRSWGEKRGWLVAWTDWLGTKAPTGPGTRQGRGPCLLCGLRFSQMRAKGTAWPCRMQPLWSEPAYSPQSPVSPQGSWCVCGGGWGGGRGASVILATRWRRSPRNNLLARRRRGSWWPEGTRLRFNASISTGGSRHPREREIHGSKVPGFVPKAPGKGRTHFSFQEWI